MTVYFAQIGRDGPIKIGDTDNVKSRIRQLQTVMPWPLTLLRVLPSLCHNTAAIYAHFARARMRGEWFYPTRELLDFIAKPYSLRSPTSADIANARAHRGSSLAFLKGPLAHCADLSLWERVKLCEQTKLAKKKKIKDVPAELAGFQ